MNIPELRVFVTAAEELNFSRAATRLHLSQSAVSQNIQSIEKSYGVELFVRHGRSVQLSEVGHVILPMAREVLNSMRLLEDSLINVKGDVAGELTIGCSTTSGKYILPYLLAAFRREYSLVRSRVAISSRSAVVERLLDQTLALGVMSRQVEHRDLEYMPLLEDRVILIVPVNHPWADYGRAMPADLLDQPFIVREESSGTAEVVANALKQQGVMPDMLNVVMELGNAEAITMAVEEGIGIAFVSELVAARGLALGRIKQVNIHGLDILQRIYLYRQAGAVFTRAEARFWDFVQENRAQILQAATGRFSGITAAV
ncbi:MAG: LysR family transcriptional regulator [Anaerolineales bacterium]|jgi:DNA-binding transcriptional LysR family regulator|nr:LysR family transcriptional regulator [Anaerolineales bacterium]